MANKKSDKLISKLESEVEEIPTDKDMRVGRAEKVYIQTMNILGFGTYNTGDINKYPKKRTAPKYDSEI